MNDQLFYVIREYEMLHQEFVGVFSSVEGAKLATEQHAKAHHFQLRGWFVPETPGTEYDLFNDYDVEGTYFLSVYHIDNVVIFNDQFPINVPTN